MFNLYRLLSELFTRITTPNERAHANVSDDDPIDVSFKQPASPPPDVEQPDIETVAAWCGSASLTNPERDVAFAKRVGINRLDIILNDHSLSRKPRAFDVRPLDRVTYLAECCRKAGIEPAFMSWIMPHAGYVRAAGRELVKLCILTGAKTVILDAEETWTLARKKNGRRLSRGDYEEAAAWVEEYIVKPLEEIGVTVGVTGIRYAPVKALSPLLARVRLWVPQCYSTRTSKADPSTVVTKGVERWMKVFGKEWSRYNGPGVEPTFEAALAGYRQTGIKGHTVASAMLAALDNADDHARTVVYWGLNSIRKSPRVARIIRSIRDGAAVPDLASRVETKPEGVPTCGREGCSLPRAYVGADYCGAACSAQRRTAKAVLS